jgi:hypothetical protein
MTVSLMLLSLITIIGYQGLMFGLKQWQNGSDKMSFQYDYFQAESWLRQKLGTSEKIPAPHSKDYNYLFTGKPDSLKFVARYNRSNDAGLYVNKIKLNKIENRLYVSYYLHHPDIEADSLAGGTAKVVLLSEVHSIAFLYYGNRKGKAARWHKNWEDAQHFPKLVRVKIQSNNGQLYESTIHMATSSDV